MVLYSSFCETLIYLFIYMFIYNISLILLFWVLQQYINTNFKTLYSFNDLKFNVFYLTTVTIILFSMAGVPPFIGFFTKLIILVSLIHLNFFHLYVIFFLILFLSLYFYVQNIRFLYSTSTSTIDYSFEINVRNVYSIYLIIIFFLYFIVFGVLFFNDLILYFSWLLF